MFKTLALTILFTASPVGETYFGTAVRVVDGDTLYVEVPGWPKPFTPIEVRINEIDTPESRYGVMGAKCEKEKRLGLITKGWLKERIPPGTKVELRWSGEKEKYGRLLAHVFVDGKDIGNEMIKKGYAVEYHGATKGDWCK